MVLRKFFFAVLALVFLGGCWEKGDSANKEIFILCDRIFLNAVSEFAAEFETKTGISTVINLIESEGVVSMADRQEGDILITYDPFYERVSQAGALAANTEAGIIVPVIAVGKGNPKGIKNIEDLGGEGIKTAFADPNYSNCGRMIFDLMGSLGIKNDVLANTGNRFTKNDIELGHYLKTGAVDAVIISNGAAKNFGDSLEIIPLPDEYNIGKRIHIIGLSYSKNSMAVIHFIELARDRAPQIFAKHGYSH